MDFLGLSIGIPIGAAVVGLIVTSILKSKLDVQNRSILEKSERLEKLETELQVKSDDQISKVKLIAGLEEELKQERKQFDEKLTLLDDAKNTMAIQFKNLANDIFEEKGKKFTEKNKETLEIILGPLKENLDGFRKKIEETYISETKERVVLKEELKRLAQLNERLGDEAESLTNALVGQSQTQGAWGEMILETLLEQSGLVNGVQYHSQHSGTNEEGQRLRPDVIIRLPEGKDIIVDSKVSLTAYRQFCAATDKDASAKYLSDHVKSLRTHVKELADKNYYDLTNVNSLDYVLMFVPIEGAFSIAVHSNHELVTEALASNVVIVTPTTLLLALRTIENIWRYEAQTQNAQQIATKAGQLYDKFVGFVGDVEDVGKLIGKASTAQENAIKKLSEGKGNLVNRTEELKKLGAKANKSLPTILLEEIEPDQTDDLS